ncbi:helix-turn-helix transcriptional regulator [uncultured Acidaminococcus sp.]|jgi:hypothetical protein|uniref:helix-turn-helix domain-containing protein n=1 Tax=uncultured Acidaminococcus sp. TaxID=352152 RepID=UPI00205C4242|nr:helix-turn-helix transcriptional regulator [uncultured Acidaminococcus sp.]DAI60271.1 MAG TPA: repressor protein [Caudoviricetes sp.]
MDAEMMENVRQNEKYYRIKAGVSAKHIGEITGHCDSWIIMFESSVIKNLRDQDMQKIAEALGVKLKDLVKPAREPVLSITKEEHERGLKNLEKIRIHRKLTRQQFNAILGLSKAYFRKVMVGYSHFGIKSWWRIADALHMDLKVLIGRE